MSDIINESATQDRISVSTWVSVRRAVWLLVHILLSHQGCGKTTIPTSIYAAAAAAVSLEYLLERLEGQPRCAYSGLTGALSGEGCASTE